MKFYYLGTTVSDLTTIASSYTGFITRYTDKSRLHPHVSEGISVTSGHNSTGGFSTISFETPKEFWVSLTVSPTVNGDTSSSETGYRMVTLRSGGLDLCSLTYDYSTASPLLEPRFQYLVDRTTTSYGQAYFEDLVNQVDIHVKLDGDDGFMHLYVNRRLQVEAKSNFVLPDHDVVRELALTIGKYRSDATGRRVVYSRIIVADSDTRFLRMFDRDPQQYGSKADWNGPLSSVVKANINDTTKISYDSDGAEQTFVSPTHLGYRSSKIKAIGHTYRVRALNDGQLNRLGAFVEIEGQPRIDFDTIEVTSNDFANRTAIATVNPNTGSEFTRQELNKAQYGVKALPALPAETPNYIVFDKNGTFIPPEGWDEVDVLIVAGGGAGGFSDSSSIAGSGGGAGGIRILRGYPVQPGRPIEVVVGEGGIDSNGGNSSFDGNIAIGGGKGHGYVSGSGVYSAHSGGSGGGLNSYTGYTGPVSQYSVEGIPGQGKRGGYSTASLGSASAIGGSGGGGYRTKGGVALIYRGADGGDGFNLSEIGWGDAIAYGAPPAIGGGGGGGDGGAGAYYGANSGSGGRGGGGRGGTSGYYRNAANSGVSGQPKTGGGGGGIGTYYTTSGGDAISAGQGGSGMVVVRKAIPYDPSDELPEITGNMYPILVASSKIIVAGADYPESVLDWDEDIPLISILDSVSWSSGEIYIGVDASTSSLAEIKVDGVRHLLTYTTTTSGISVFRLPSTFFKFKPEEWYTISDLIIYNTLSYQVSGGYAGYRTTTPGYSGPTFGTMNSRIVTHNVYGLFNYGPTGYLILEGDYTDRESMTVRFRTSADAITSKICVDPVYDPVNNHTTFTAAGGFDYPVIAATNMFVSVY